MIKKIISIIILINMILLINLKIYSVFAITQTTSSDINAINTQKYPLIKEKIQELKKIHPNWNFKILYTGIDWNEAVACEYTGHGSSPKNLVPDMNEYAGEWICSYCGDKTYDSGYWKCASNLAIKYMMDSRVFMNSNDIFQFLELSNDEKGNYSKEVLQKMLAGSFLDNNTYLDTILNSSKTYNVNPYYIAARILQEQGKSGSVLTAGKGYNGQYVGYYNVFNIGATGSGKDKVILNGLAKAKNYDWSTMEKALDGGIKIISSSYIAVGQNTLYLQKFDVDNSDGALYWHQYMQNIVAAQNEGTTLRKTLESINAIDNGYTFIIPVYENMPKTISQKPNNTIKIDNLEGADLVKINVTDSIRIRNEPNGSVIKGYLYSGEIATRLEKATSKVNGTYWDKILKSNGTCGYVARCTYDSESVYKEYLVSIGKATTNNIPNNNQTNNNTINNTNTTTNSNTVNTSNGTTNNNTISNTNTTNMTQNTNSNTNTTNSAQNIINNTNNSTNTTSVQKEKDQKQSIVKGDVNGDNKRDSADLLYLKKYLLNKISLTEEQKRNSDTNNDNKIDSADLLNIKKHLLGKITL